MIYRVRHRTSYGYSEPVPLSHNIAHLRPRSGRPGDVSLEPQALEPLLGLLEGQAQHVRHSGEGKAAGQCEADRRAALDDRRRRDRLGDHGASP